MKTILRISFLSFLLFTLGCSKDDNEVPVAPKSDAKAITSFVFNASDNAALSENITSNVTEASKTASSSVPNGTDLTALTPTIQVSAKANVSPSGAQDFSNPVTYTVTAEDGSTAKYIASVMLLDAENSAPLEFDLIAVTDNAVAVDVLPTFSWNATSDPDGDTITYDLYLDMGSTADELYAENITDTTFELTERLSLLEDYTWKVIAKDPHGAFVSSASRNFSTRAVRFNDIAVTTNANFSDRSSHSSVVFDNKIWVIGGADDDARMSDVWFSSDGLTWQEATSAAPFGARSGHSTVVFNNKLWLIGGFDGTRKNDVWSSEDGITWVEASSAAPFSGRSSHTTVVFDNKLWVIGGNDGSRKNDVWFSSDGITWSEATNEASFTGRSGHTSVVFDNKLWVIGGTANGFQNDVWFSEDGVLWSEATNAGPFSSRTGHTSVVFDNKIWVIGGWSGGPRLRDVWSSSDGVNWTKVVNMVPFMERYLHASVVFDNKVFVIAGFGFFHRNDVWFFD